mmetsp:Transcript_12100/g.20412  ORF Transcript_12100/g.20412 Transcript_12100/m.20412 type:complete len:138 (+) Transcript_12100:453-866(+)
MRREPAQAQPEAAREVQSQQPSATYIFNQLSFPYRLEADKELVTSQSPLTHRLSFNQSNQRNKIGTPGSQSQAESHSALTSKTPSFLESVSVPMNVSRKHSHGLQKKQDRDLDLGFETINLNFSITRNGRSANASVS